MVLINNYFSWSRYSLFKASKKEFYKRYVIGEKSKSNKYFDKGKELAESLELDQAVSWSKDEMLPLLIYNIPKLDVMEDKLEVELDGIETLCYIDSASYDYSEFLEYKTSKSPWTKEMVLEHEQLDLYALAIWEHSNRKIIPKCKLVWVETKETKSEKYNNLIFTGRYEEFDREFTKDELLVFREKFISRFHEIISYQFKEVDLDDKIVKKYIKLLEKKDSIEESINSLKSKILIELDLNETDRGVSVFGNFSIVNTNSYKYTDSLTEIKKELLSEIKKYESWEKRAGLAISIPKSSYIKFSKAK